MTTITLKEFKSRLLNNKSQLLGSIYDTELTTIIDIIDNKLSTIKITYDRQYVSKGNSSLLTSEEGRIDLSGKVYFYKGVYILVSGKDTIIYAIKEARQLTESETLQLEIKNHRNEMIKQFNNMEKLPIIEYEYEDGEFDVFYIAADNQGLHVIGTRLSIEWDYVLTLDEHLQEVYDSIANSYN